ncbi:MAG: hypothetical protein QOF21_2925, partial [Actinomycetota bacterium]
MSQHPVLDRSIEDELEALQAELRAAVANVDRLRDAISNRAAEAARLRREEGQREAERVLATANGEADLLEARANGILATLTISPEPELTLDDVLAPTRPPGEEERLLVPVLGYRQELVLRAMLLFGVAAACWFWMWWLGEGHGTWTAPSVMVSVLFGWVTVLSLYFFFFVARMTRPNPALPVPQLRVA